MSWKKNTFSYLTWLVYTVLVCGILVWTAGDLCAEWGAERYWGIPAALLVLAGAGGTVFLVRRRASASAPVAEKGRRLFLVLEAAAVAAFLALGLAVRLSGMESAGQRWDYFEAARVREGWQAPGLTHAAAYLYVRLLHGLFVLLGNRLAVGIWLQMIAQLGAFLLLFFAVRKLAGRVGALVCFGFCCCSPYMAGEALVLSPAMPYFFLFMIVFLWAAAGCTGGQGDREDAPNSAFLVYLFQGVLTAFCCYLDISGFLLVFMCLSLIFTGGGQGVGCGGWLRAAGWYMAGVLAGLVACILWGGFAGGTTVWQAAENWLGIGWPGAVWRLEDLKAWRSGPETVLLSYFTALGIFGFWCDRHREHVTACVLPLCGIATAGFCGVFREEMPGYFALYVLLVLWAGMGAGQLLRTAKQEECGERYGWEALIEKMEENESMRAAREQEREQEEGQIQFIENPLPLPKKHVKRVMDYSLQPAGEEDDFDYIVPEEDDFDL